MAQDFDFMRFAVGGAQRPDSFSGLEERFRDSLAQMFSSAPPEIQQNLRFMSGYRSPQRQAELWQGALQKYGSADAARKWVAPPGNSKHNHGSAVDLRYLQPAAREWVHANAANYGLHFPMKHEPWHIEPIGSRGGHQHAPQAPGTPAPAMPVPQMVADAPVAPFQPPQQPIPATPQGEQGGLGAMMAAFAPKMPPMTMQQPAVQVDFGQGDPMATVAAAQQGREKTKNLLDSVAPEIERILGIAKRPVGVV